MAPKAQNLSQSAAQQAPRQKILRIGVILGDKIVEERLMRERKPVTIGQSAKNTFAVPASELPRTWTLFGVSGHQYTLHVSDSMDGRISDGGQVMTMAQIKGGGKAQRVGQAWTIPLSEGARGKIVIGDMTLLFQFVQAPPLQPKPQLPHSVRGGLADRIDPYLAVIMAASLVLHGLVFGWAKFFVDEPVPPTADVIPDQFARVVMQRPKPPTPKKEEKGPEKAEEKKDDKKDDKKKDEKKEVKPEAPPDQAQVKAKVENSATFHALDQLRAKAAAGDGQAIATQDNRVAWGDLGDKMKRLGNDPSAQIGTAGGQNIRGGGTGEVAAGGGTGVNGPHGPGSTGGEKKEEEIKVGGQVEKIDAIESAGLDPDKVMGIIKARYYPGVLRCYSQALKTNPTLGGKISVNFTVGAAGNVVKVSVDGFDGGVNRCVEAEARRWRFDKPTDSSGANFEIPFVLRRM